MSSTDAGEQGSRLVKMFSETFYDWMQLLGESGVLGRQAIRLP